MIRVIVCNWNFRDWVSLPGNNVGCSLHTGEAPVMLSINLPNLRIVSKHNKLFPKNKYYFKNTGCNCFLGLIDCVLKIGRRKNGLKFQLIKIG